MQDIQSKALHARGVLNDTRLITVQKEYGAHTIQTAHHARVEEAMGSIPERLGSAKHERNGMEWSGMRWG